MKRYVYPAILYTDTPNAGYIICISDLGLVVEGDTPEEAFILMKNYMENFFECAFNVESEIPEASSYIKMAKAKSQNTIIFIDIKVKGGRVI